MIIAIDLDGVVFDTEEYYRTYAHLYNIKLVKNGVIDKKEINIPKRYGWNNDIINDFYEKYTEEIITNAPFKPGARYVINELKKLGHTLICITLRGYHQYEIDITEKRLKESNITFDKIIYNQRNKLTACQKEKVDLIIDDNPNTIKLLSENNIKCFHFRGAGLKRVKHKNAIEVQNWGDIFEKIMELK